MLKLATFRYRGNFIEARRLPTGSDPQSGSPTDNIERAMMHLNSWLPVDRTGVVAVGVGGRPA